MKNVRKIGIIGDVHGKVTTYLQRIHKFDATIQVGDFGFKIDWEKVARKKVDPDYHKIIPGNHEDYAYLLKEKPAYNIGDFGYEYFHGMQFFYVRGAYSIDDIFRMIGISWWQEEQLNWLEQERALTEYETVKPEMMITHTLPCDVVEVMFPFMGAIRCGTTSLFQEMFAIHKPKLWICGHFHPYKIMMKNILGTEFMVLPELAPLTYLPDKTLDENIEIYREQYYEK